MALMGVDIGSTNMKCVVIDPGGRLLSLAKTPTNILAGASGEGHYQYGEKLFQSVLRLCAEAWHAVRGERFEGLAVTGVGCAGILLDAKDWQLAFPGGKRLIDPMPGLSPEEYRDTCGYSKSYQFSIHALAQFLSEHPDLGKAPLSLLSVGDYINFRLTGVKRRDRSTAGSATLVNRKTGGNWTEFLSVHGIDERMLPPLCHSGDYIGEMILPTEATGLPAGVPVFAGGMDYLCAAFAAGCTGDGDIVDVLGTFELLASFHSTPQHTGDVPDFATFMDHHVYPGRHTVTAETLSAGHLERRFNTSGSGNGTMNRLFEALDALPNDRIDWDSGSLAAAITSLNRASAKLFEYQRRVAGEAPPFVKVVGGGSASRFWMQNKADVTGLTFHVPGIPEATATGAALLAGVGCGVYCSHEQTARVFDDAPTLEYNPNPKLRRYYEDMLKGE